MTLPSREFGQRPAAFDRALKEMNRPKPNLERAFNLFLKAHEAGYVYGTYAVGTWYLHGQFVKEDHQKGVGMIRAAAESGVPEAQYDYAVSLETGDGVRKSIRRAVTFYLKAALQGDKDALFEMGRCLYHGIGVSKNRELARVFRAASEAR